MAVITIGDGAEMFDETMGPMTSGFASHSTAVLGATPAIETTSDQAITPHVGFSEAEFKTTLLRALTLTLEKSEAATERFMQLGSERISREQQADQLIFPIESLRAEALSLRADPEAIEAAISATLATKTRWQKMQVSLSQQAQELGLPLDSAIETIKAERIRKEDVDFKISLIRQSLERIDAGGHDDVINENTHTLRDISGRVTKSWSIKLTIYTRDPDLKFHKMNTTRVPVKTIPAGLLRKVGINKMKDGPSTPDLTAGTSSPAINRLVKFCEENGLEIYVEPNYENYDLTFRLKKPALD